MAYAQKRKGKSKSRKKIVAKRVVWSECEPRAHAIIHTNCLSPYRVLLVNSSKYIRINLLIARFPRTLGAGERAAEAVGRLHAVDLSMR